MSAPATLVAVLRDQVERRPDQVVFTFLDDGETADDTLTFAQLHVRAAAVASVVATTGSVGDRIPIVLPAGLGFIEAFVGCLYAGRLPVPLAPPRRRGLLEDCRRIDRIAAVTDATAIVASPDAMAQLVEHAPWFGGQRVRRIDVDGEGEPGDGDPQMPVVDPRPHDLAYLQYTSGSTLEPRGVMVTHGNVLAATRHAARAFQVDRSARIVSWLPHYHDMGLVGVILQSIVSGCRSWLMSPRAFAAKPDRWLRAISHHEGSHSGGPDAAFDLCARRAAASAAELKLEAWRCAFTGAEPVRIDTLERFARAFAPSGFRMESFRPTYGLAEATLQVTGGPIGVLPRTHRFKPAAAASDPEVPRTEDVSTPVGDGAFTAVSCGRTWLGTSVRIVDPETRRPVPEGEVGEIWIRGPQVAAGYYGDATSTDAVFGARLAGSRGPTYLRSGDLGALVDDELFVVGRLKDVIILNGVNHQPSAVEQAVLTREPTVEAGTIVAIGSARDGRERLVVLVEVRRRVAPDLAARIRTAIFDGLDLTVHHVTFVPVGTFPRTTSGKIRRSALRAAYESGRLSIQLED